MRRACPVDAEIFGPEHSLEDTKAPAAKEDRKRARSGKRAGERVTAFALGEVLIFASKREFAAPGRMA
jgi:hypothetical protein